LVERAASIGSVEVMGTFMRHAAPNRDAFAGGYAGRWGESFPVIYLGRPLDSCIEEAYRHLVDEAGVPAHLVKSRTLYRVRVETRNITTASLHRPPQVSARHWRCSAIVWVSPSFQ
jgi:hypothetical protein